MQKVTAPRRKPAQTIVRRPRARDRRNWAWLALVAMLCQALAPSFAAVAASAAMSPESGRIPVCTPHGLIWVSLDANGAPAKPQTPAERPCPFCLHKAAPPTLSGGPPVVDIIRTPVAPAPVAQANRLPVVFRARVPAIRAPPAGI
jgi:Protein of unknown function (DUF2946)